MPNRDQTGPLGQGPLTGRGLGPCGPARGFGRCLGRFFGQVSLPDYQKALKEELADVEKEISSQKKDK